MMNKINILCKVSSNDDFNIENSEVVFYSKKEYSDYFQGWFWQNDAIFNGKFNKFFEYSAIDLLYISFFVFFADCRYNRSKSFDRWTRSFHLNIPVLELDKWNKIKLTLQEMLNFLSGDIWEFSFRNRELNGSEKWYKSRINYSTDACDRISMFSGGMDSYIHAINLLSENIEGKFLSITSGGNVVGPRQEEVKELLISKYMISDSDFIRFGFRILKETSNDNIKMYGLQEDTTRTRSFMFFSHAVALATGYKNQVKIIIPENGVISLNVPLDYSRSGSNSTRTTHPYYLELFQKIISEIAPNVSIKNPYQFNTKGEMALDCKDYNFLKRTYSKTMSCSHPFRFGESEVSHCGVCLPCIIRRAATNKAKLPIDIYKNDLFTFDTEKRIFTNTGSPKQNYHIYNRFLNRITPIIGDNMKLFSTLLEAGPIDKDIMNYINVFKRGVIELKEIMDVINEKIS